MSRASPAPGRLIRMRHVLAVWVALALASQLYQCRPQRPPSADGFGVYRLRDRGGASVFMAAMDLPAPSGAPAAPPVLLLHSSPMHSFDLHPLAERLAQGRRVLLPDLPGFGRSQRRVADYSFAAQAAFVRQWLNELDVPRVHVVGYGQGGGAALMLQQLAPERVASVTLLSSIGVQELELLGDYGLNQGLYRVQLAALQVVNWGLPHFGAMDRFPLNIPYARSLLDSDQRLLRGVLQQIEAPVLIVHGRGDLLVPTAVAKEHHRVVPQSEIAWLRGGHVLALTHPAQVAAPIREFLDRVDAGAARTRGQADTARAAVAAVPFTAGQVEPASGLALVVLMALIVAGMFVNEDLSCIGAGLLAANGLLAYCDAALAAFLGIFSCDLMLFAAGRWLGRPALSRRPFSWFFREESIEQSARWFDERGPWVIILSRFIPGSRLPTYITAGLLHRGTWRYVLFFAIAGMLWAPLLVWISMSLGGRVLHWVQQYRALTITVAIVVAFLLWLALEWVVPAFTFKGRRLLIGKWRRLTRWEFWPAWLVYPPVAIYLLWLGIRHRGLTACTACNPALADAGFIGESKSAILARFAGAGDAIAPWILLPADRPAHERIAGVRDFVRGLATPYPVVIKPDVGRGGRGVAVLRSEAEVAAYFQRPRPAVIAQAFAPGHELSVFYIRRPAEMRGRIFALTDKRFTSVRGDGVSSLERLILMDDRAVCMAPFFLRRHAANLRGVPAQGERVLLTELGTHGRGALFRDGMDSCTPAVEEAIDRIGRCCEGFHFGRFDLRAPSLEEFQRGRSFQVIEIDGVASEASSIYDPAYSLSHAWGMLMRQWREAFEIGAANRDRGARVLTVRELIAALLRYRAAPEA